jgi:hypothetical protein
MSGGLETTLILHFSCDPRACLLRLSEELLDYMLTDHDRLRSVTNSTIGHTVRSRNDS